MKALNNFMRKKIYFFIILFTIYINRYMKIANVMLGSLPHQMTRLVEQLQLVLRMSFLVYMLRSCNFFLMV